MAAITTVIQIYTPVNILAERSYKLNINWTHIKMPSRAMIHKSISMEVLTVETVTTDGSSEILVLRSLTGN